MQFYRDGYRPGSPDIHPAAPEAIARTHDLPDEVDVLIVGTGPAGTMLAAQLAEFPEIDTRIIERRSGPLELGHADGVACRTVEMFQAFGLADDLVREACWITEVRFWGPSEADRSCIVRTGRVRDTPPGLSEFPHVIVNQARMQEYLLDHMRHSASRLTPDYGMQFVTLRVDDAGDHPVIVTLRPAAGGRASEEFTVRARYVVGCDGAHSRVRQAIGCQLHGDDANHAWGVMDVLATTDFPDWRTKNVVQSDGRGSLLMIPREGGNMVRCYVDLGTMGDGDVRDVSVEQLVARTNAILHPYVLDVRSVAWSSVYEVGQRLTDTFDDVPAGAEKRRTPRVFIAGDACHTHSAKAGLGMNVSMQDAFNLGWKLAAVLRGQAEASLLHSYSDERQAVAEELIEFDRFWSGFIAEPIADPAHPERGGITSEQMEEQFARQGRYTAGLATRYAPSRLTGDGTHQALATGFEVGTRFHSAPVIRVCDMRRLELGHTHRADGRWRMYVFDGVGDGGHGGHGGGHGALELAAWLSDSPDSPVNVFRPAGVDGRPGDIDGVIDVHTVFRCDPHGVTLTELPEILLPHSGPLGLQDWEKVWTADPAADVFTLRGIADAGAVVVVRPDQYVAHVLPLSARSELTTFFDGILRRPGRGLGAGPGAGAAGRPGAAGRRDAARDTDAARRPVSR